MVFKLLGENSSSGTVGVWGAPRSVPLMALAAKGSCSGERLSPAQRPSEPGALHCPLACASPYKKGRVPKVGFADEHSVA